MKRFFVLLAVTLTVSALATTAFAQSANDVGVFFDPAGTNTTTTAAGFAQFNMYMIGFDLAGEVKGFEMSVSVPAELLVLSRGLAGGGSAINIGSGDNFIVGTGVCLDGAGPFTLVTYNLGYFGGPVAPDDMVVCIGPSVPTSFAPASPGYLQCDPDGVLVPFTVAVPGDNYPGGCGVINPLSDPPVSNTNESFGSVKSRF